MKLRESLFSFTSIVIGIVLAFALLEVTCRVLPVSDSLKALPVSSANPILRFEGNRDITWSRGSGFSIITKKHVNNYGFLNDQDYRPEETSPLLAIVGDSFVEAAQVENRNSLHGIASKATAGRGRVYSFGASGSALPNYLTYAHYATDRFHARAIAFIIVGNDFDESLTKYKTTPGYHYFSDSSGHLELVRLDYRPTFLKRLSRESALMRYLLLNVQFDLNSVKNMFRFVAPGAQPEFVGNTLADDDERRVADSKAAIDKFIEELPLQTGLGKDKILFVLDGLRPDLYDTTALLKARGSYANIMRLYFIEAATSRGYETIDMQPVFLSTHERAGTRFEFPSDGHWNEAGHGLVAAQICASAVWRALFGGQSDRAPGSTEIGHPVP